MKRPPRFTKAEYDALMKAANSVLSAGTEDQTYEVVKDTKGKKAANAYLSALDRAATKLGWRID